MVAGVCVVAVLALEKVWEHVWIVMFLAAGLLIYAIWGMRSVADNRPVWAGNAGRWLVTAGGGLLFILGILAFGAEVAGKDPETLYPSWVEFGFPIGGLMLALGLLLFGISAIVGGRLPRVPFALMFLFLPVGLGIDAAMGNLDNEDGFGYYIGFGMLAVGLLWLGWHLWSRNTPESSELPTATPV